MRAQADRFPLVQNLPRFVDPRWIFLERFTEKFDPRRQPEIFCIMQEVRYSSHDPLFFGSPLLIRQEPGKSFPPSKEFNPNWRIISVVKPWPEETDSREGSSRNGRGRFRMVHRFKYLERRAVVRQEMRSKSSRNDDKYSSSVCSFFPFRSVSFFSNPLPCDFSHRNSRHRSNNIRLFKLKLKLVYPTSNYTLLMKVTTIIMYTSLPNHLKVSSRAFQYLRKICRQFTNCSVSAYKSYWIQFPTNNCCHKLTFVKFSANHHPRFTIQSVAFEIHVRLRHKWNSRCFLKLNVWFVKQVAVVVCNYFAGIYEQYWTYYIFVPCVTNHACLFNRTKSIIYL